MRPSALQGTSHSEYLTDVMTRAENERQTAGRSDWKSPMACEIADAVWTIHRSYDLVCGLAADTQHKPLKRRQLQWQEERRRERRRKLCLPVELRMVQTVDNRLVVTSERIAAVTHDLSEGGVGLRHDRELKTRFVVAEFDVMGEPVLLLLDKRWTQKEDELSYITGARLVMVLEPDQLVPLEGLGKPDLGTDLNVSTILQGERQLVD